MQNQKNPKYLTFIRQLPCFICNNPQSSPHHVRNRFMVPEKLRGGVSLKPYDETCVPLCREHHQECERSYAAFEKKYCVSLSHQIMILLVTFIRGGKL